jgi:hypothetical protein
MLHRGLVDCRRGQGLSELFGAEAGGVDRKDSDEDEEKGGDGNPELL